MLKKSRATCSALGLDNVEFREGLAELVAGRRRLGRRCHLEWRDRTSAPTSVPCSTRPGGCYAPEVLQFADMANGRPVPPEALHDIDLRTD
jgi:arsenite methyltransferase